MYYIHVSRSRWYVRWSSTDASIFFLLVLLYRIYLLSILVTGFKCLVFVPRAALCISSMSLWVGMGVFVEKSADVWVFHVHVLKFSASLFFLAQVCFCLDAALLRKAVLVFRLCGFCVLRA